MGYQTYHFHHAVYMSVTLTKLAVQHQLFGLQMFTVAKLLTLRNHQNIAIIHRLLIRMEDIFTFYQTDNIDQSTMIYGVVFQYHQVMYLC